MPTRGWRAPAHQDVSIPAALRRPATTDRLPGRTNPGTAPTGQRDRRLHLHSWARSLEVEQNKVRVIAALRIPIA